jgi:ABC-2 type transport system ATP-binding protein
VVAVDTAENLTRGVTDTGRFILTVQGSATETAAVLASVPGITSARPMDTTHTAGGTASFLVESERDAGVRVPLFHALAVKSIPIIELRTVGVSLEDVFLQLTGESEEGEQRG